MLANSFNAELYSDWLSHIVDIETKEAFIHIVGYAACLVKYQCHPQFKGKNGPLRDFRFYDSNNEMPFAFIVNQQWLLFYFRAPAVRSKQYAFDGIKAVFPSALINNGGEWTIKIRSISDVKALIKTLGIQ
jgi:hypothetical protein